MKAKPTDKNVKTTSSRRNDDNNPGDANTRDTSQTTEKKSKSRKADEKPSSKSKTAGTKNEKADKDGKVKKSKKTSKPKTAQAKVDKIKAALLKAEVEAAKEKDAAGEYEQSKKTIEHGELSAAAHPMAPPLVDMEISSLLFKGNEINPKFAIRGVKEVTKMVRRMADLDKGSKKTTALAIFAGDIAPVDIMTHLPEMCDRVFVPFIWVRSQKLLGQALGTGRKSCVALIQKNLPEPAAMKNSKDSHEKGKGSKQADIEQQKSKHDVQMAEWTPIFKKLLKIWGEVARLDPVEPFDSDKELLEAQIANAQASMLGTADQKKEPKNPVEAKEPRAKKIKTEHR